MHTQVVAFQGIPQLLIGLCLFSPQGPIGRVRGPYNTPNGGRDNAI